MSISRIPASTTEVTSPDEQLTDQDEQRVYNADVRHLLRLAVKELRIANLHSEDITGIQIDTNEIED